MSDVTKRALEASLKNLLLQKPFNKITVSDIAADCGINRMTFYYHFKDIYELAEWSLEEDAARIIADKKTYDTWQEGFCNIFNAVLENKTFIIHMYHSISREQMENYLYKLVHSLMIGVIEEQSKGLHVTEDDKQFIAAFYKYAFVGIMLDWVKNGMQEEPKEIVARITILIQGDISRALHKFETYGTEYPFASKPLK